MVFGSGNKFRIRRSTSKASYLAYIRTEREHERGLPDFVGSYKRTKSPNGRENISNHISECDRLPRTESVGALIEKERLSTSHHRYHNHHHRASSSDESNISIASSVCSSASNDSGCRTNDALYDHMMAYEKQCSVPPHLMKSLSVPVINTNLNLTKVIEIETQTPNHEPVTVTRIESVCSVETVNKEKKPIEYLVKAPVSTQTQTGDDTVGSVGEITVTEVQKIGQTLQRSELLFRVNSTSDAASQTDLDKVKVETEVPILPSRQKSKVEIECEELSRDLANQLSLSEKLHGLLVPAPEHKKPSDYVTGLFRIDITPRPRPSVPIDQNKVKVDTETKCNGHVPSDVNNRKSISPLPANSAYFTTSEPKAKLLTRYSKDMGQADNINDKELLRKKNELMNRLDRKLEVLREEHLVIAEECQVNDALGDSVAKQVEQHANPQETSKYRLHVEEVGKITSLLLSLSGRLARAENALMGLPDDHPERKILESKRDKLKDQLEEAKKLKENIDRRSISVSNMLYKYFSSEEYADYDHFINMKAKLIMDSREIADKIKLGEEQLAALKETLSCPG